ncbi:MAG: glycosyltransferase family 4 protein [Methylococcaceae bacterium]|nr:glycosyltransferase family 4 protein [Methylococcaceae bacterium]
MKITFVTPNINLTGGLRVVSIYAELLCARGHSITIVSPRKDAFNFRQKIKFLFRRTKTGHKPTFDDSFFKNAPYDVKILNANRVVSDADVPDADIVIATFWITAEWISSFSSKKGIKVYFLQHYEIHPWLPVERVKATLFLPFKKVTVAQWITDILRDDYNCDDSIVVPNGVDLNQFSSPVRNKQALPTIGMMYSSRIYKGSDIAIDAFIKAKAVIPQLQLIAFGTEQPEIALPEGSLYFERPNQAQLKDIYNRCDAWLFTSRTEGFGLPILEAMACRTPVIGSNCGAAPQLIDARNGILVDVDNIDQTAEAILKYAEMRNDDWLVASEAAYQTALKNKWEYSCDQFEQALLNFIKSDKA